MNYSDDRQMFDVDATCATCGTHISQLPFQPSGDRPVYCGDCNRNRRDQFRNSRPQRQMYDVNVACSSCGTMITQLPFQPKDTSNILCKGCYLKNKE